MVADTSTLSAVVSMSVPISPGVAPFGGWNCTVTGNFPLRVPTRSSWPASGREAGGQAQVDVVAGVAAAHRDEPDDGRDEPRAGHGRRCRR